MEIIEKYLKILQTLGLFSIINAQKEPVKAKMMAITKAWNIEG